MCRRRTLPGAGRMERSTVPGATASPATAGEPATLAHGRAASRGATASPTASWSTPPAAGTLAHGRAPPHSGRPPPRARASPDTGPGATGAGRRTPPDGATGAGEPARHREPYRAPSSPHAPAYGAGEPVHAGGASPRAGAPIPSKPHRLAVSDGSNHSLREQMFDRSEHTFDRRRFTGSSILGSIRPRFFRSGAGANIWRTFTPAKNVL